MDDFTVRGVICVIEYSVCLCNNYVYAFTFFNNLLLVGINIY